MSLQRPLLECGERRRRNGLIDRRIATTVERRVVAGDAEGRAVEQQLVDLKLAVMPVAAGHAELPLDIDGRQQLPP